MDIAQSRAVTSIGTSAVAKLLGVSHRTVLHWVATDQLEPVAKLDGKTGAYIFDLATIEALKDEDA